ncbi:hypothetical protein HPP92_026345 [Vanilla planifolia]|uniref:Uncharacterized protein n=1 Tax=Vanilla planifolia TaxID=51239 RepID=A0A835PGQ0_VANPL|nr:hypothetical protein HPP92_026345 [Vanilla planifolia]
MQNSSHQQFITSNGNGPIASRSASPLVEEIEADQIVVPEEKSWKNLFAFMGPGFLVSIAYIDPGNFETDLQSGAQYKYELLWIILVASIAALIIQSLAAKLGVVTGKHLAEHCRAEYSKAPNFVLWLLAELAVVACDIPEVCFFIELGYAKPRFSEVMKGLFIPKLNGNGSTGLAISLLGAMVMPHNLFLHSALVLSRRVSRSVHGIKEACRYYTLESAIALAFAFLINVSIISLSGAVCSSPHLNPEDKENCEDLDLNKASFLLKNVLGKWSSKLFAIALLASGQSSTITGTYAGQYVMQGFLDLRITPWKRNLLTRSLAIVPSLIVAIIGGSSGAGKLIIIASMILSFELPFALLPLLKFTSSKTKMGSHVNSLLISSVTWIIGLLIMAINIYYIITGFIKLLIRSRINITLKAIAGLAGFSGILVYLSAIIYLALRKNRKSTQPLLSLDSELEQRCGDSRRDDIARMQLPQSRTALDLD